MSKTYLENNVIESNDMYDYFVLGSDQIWNYNLSGKEWQLSRGVCFQIRKIQIHMQQVLEHIEQEKEHHLGNVKTF
ncbi:MAG: hypothetical protein ACLRR3_01785 [Eubacterium sp.]